MKFILNVFTGQNCLFFNARLSVCSTFFFSHIIRFLADVWVSPACLLVCSSFSVVQLSFVHRSGQNLTWLTSVSQILLDFISHIREGKKSQRKLQEGGDFSLEASRYVSQCQTKPQKPVEINQKTCPQRKTFSSLLCSVFSVKMSKSVKLPLYSIYANLGSSSQARGHFLFLFLRFLCCCWQGRCDPAAVQLFQINARALAVTNDASRQPVFVKTPQLSMRILGHSSLKSCCFFFLFVLLSEQLFSRSQRAALISW